MRRLIIALLIALVAASPSRAGSGGKGSAAAPFLLLDPSARAAALGGALGGAVEDADAAHYNPAGLGLLERPQAAASHESRFAGLSYDHAVVAVPVLSWTDSPRRTRSLGAAALSVYSLAATGVERRGLVETDAPSGTFGAADRAVALSYGAPWPRSRLNLGGTLKFVNSRIDTSGASTLGVDLGGLWVGEAFSFGAGGRNLVGKLSRGGAADPLPALYYAGMGWRPREDLLACAELKLPREDAASLALGFERRWRPAPKLSLAARGGYDMGRRDAGGLAGAALGFGIAWGSLDFDFAWSPGGILGDSFKYAAKLRF